MTPADLQLLFEYSYWANTKFAPVIASPTPEEFTRRVAGSYGSVRNTLVHALSTEWGWLDRGGGLKRGARLEPDNYPTPESLLNDWSRVESSMRAFLHDITDEDLNRSVDYEGGGGAKRSMPLGELMHHAVNHTAHYRAQTALLLRELGRTPGNVDLLFYYSEKRGIQAW